MTNNSDIRVKVLDQRGIIEGDRLYAEGDTLTLPRARFEILRRAAKVAEAKPRKPRKQAK